MIRTVIADDSASFRAAVRALLDEHGGFQVVADARNGREAVELVEKHRPDLVVMDVLMDEMNGLQATAQIMRRVPCPVVVVSSLVDTTRQQIVFDALRAGAVEVLPKPKDVSSRAVRDAFTRTLEAMASVKVVRHRARASHGAGAHEPLELLAIGASTGGPPALESLLSRLGRNFPAPVLIGQHLASGFNSGLARWLSDTSALQVTVVKAEAAEELSPGTAYLPVDGHHLELDRHRVRSAPATTEAVTPSIDRLFSSCVQYGRGVVGVLLTGMGDDGARGLLELRRAGRHTIVQDEATSLVWGMPRAAKELGAASEELGLEAMPARLLELARGGLP